jgi:hypothetical protein
MPRRTNDFQRLLFQIEKQLAPLGAVVEESAMLPERGTGDLREVDILISLDEGQHRVRIGIECQDKSRPATKQWVEAIAKKHEELGINKTVLISSSGFYAAAQRKAESLFITVLDFTSVDKADWPTEVLRDLKVYIRDRSSTVTKLAWGITELAEGVTLEMTSNMTNALARFPDGSKADILKIVTHYGDSILKQAAGNDEGPTHAVGRLHEDLHFFRKNRLLCVVRFLFLRWRHSTKIFVIRLKPYRYRGRVLACGTAKRRGIQWTATAIAEESGIVRIRCEAPGTLKTILRFSDLTPFRSKKGKGKSIRSKYKIPPIKGGSPSAASHRPN